MMKRTPILLLIAILASAVLGLLNLGGGVWLISLGGSPYYAAAGAALVAVAVLLWCRRIEALYLYAGLLGVTLLWAVVEIGFDWWQLVPRGDLLFPLGLLLLLPWVTRHLHRRPDGHSLPWWRRPRGTLALSMGAAIVVALASMLTSSDVDGRLPAVRRGVPAAYAGAAEGDWPAYGRTWFGDKWSPLDQITPGNVGKLEVAWHIHTGDLKRPGDPDETTYEVTPIKVGGLVYLCTPHNIVMALDPETGATRWRFDPKITVPAQLQHLTCRGVSYHDAAAAKAGPAGDCPQRILMATNDARLIALDAKTGRPCASFGNNGQVDTLAGMPPHRRGWYQFTSAPLVARNLVVLGGSIYDNKNVNMPSGVIRAYDVNDGHLVWNFDPGNPGSTAPLPAGQHYSLSSPNSWSTSAADEALGLIYVPMGMGAVDQWGGNRPATTERFATTILALEMDTGRPRWSFQTVHHDLWDMDVPAQPALVDLDIPGQGRVPALVQSTKTGNIFVLDRRSGRPIRPVEERRVPQGAAQGDRLSPTQPFSSVSMMPERARERQMWGATMLDQLICRISFKRLRYDGPFTPPSTEGTLVYPGNFGVMDWGGMAIDPERQVAFAHPNYMAFVDRLIPRQSSGDGDDNGPAGGSDLHGSAEHGFNPNHGAPFAVSLNPFLSPLGLPCQAPPWGYVAGIDLVTGKVVYKRKNGTVRDETPLPLPFKMGVPTLGGPMLTASGVAFLSSTIDYYVRAYDVATGEVLWRARLPAGAQATPMTYRSDQSGRQFVIVVAGGHNSLGTALGDSVIAYGLPQAGAPRP